MYALLGTKRISFAAGKSGVDRWHTLLGEGWGYDHGKQRLVYHILLCLSFQLFTTKVTN